MEEVIFDEEDTADFHTPVKYLPINQIYSVAATAAAGPFVNTDEPPAKYLPISRVYASSSPSVNSTTGFQKVTSRNIKSPKKIEFRKVKTRKLRMPTEKPACGNGASSVEKPACSDGASSVEKPMIVYSRQRRKKQFVAVEEAAPVEMELDTEGADPNPSVSAEEVALVEANVVNCEREVVKISDGGSGCQVKDSSSPRKTDKWVELDIEDANPNPFVSAEEVTPVEANIINCEPMVVELSNGGSGCQPNDSSSLSKTKKWAELDTEGADPNPFVSVEEVTRVEAIIVNCEPGGVELLDGGSGCQPTDSSSLSKTEKWMELDTEGIDPKPFVYADRVAPVKANVVNCEPGVVELLDGGSGCQMKDSSSLSKTEKWVELDIEGANPNPFAYANKVTPAEAKIAKCEAGVVELSDGGSGCQMKDSSSLSKSDKWVEMDIEGADLNPFVSAEEVTPVEENIVNCVPEVAKLSDGRSGCQLKDCSSFSKTKKWMELGVEEVTPVKTKIVNYEPEVVELSDDGSGCEPIYFSSLSKTMKWVELNVENVDPNVFVGLLCKVCWTFFQDCWHMGFITRYDSSTGKHHIDYVEENLDVEEVDLSVETLLFHVSRDEIVEGGVYVKGVFVKFLRT